MDDVKCAISVALIMAVAAEIVIESLLKVVYMFGKRPHHLKSGLLLLS